MTIRFIKGLSITTLAAAIAACGGSDDAATGTASFDITDAPTTEFTEVFITFTGISVKPSEGKAIEFTFDEAKTLDLLTLQGGATAPLLDDTELPAGEYEWIRLTLDVDSSYVTEAGGGQRTLFIPSGAQTGLKLIDGFTVKPGGNSDFTIDFDVNKSIVDPQGGMADYYLKPVLRLVENEQASSITGQVDYALINSIRGVDDTSGELADCEYEGSIYIYRGIDVTPTELNIYSVGGPLMMVPVTANASDGFYSYEAAFLPNDNYTLAYSCQLDDNEMDDGVEFDGIQTVTVVDGKMTEAQSIPLAQ